MSFSLLSDLYVPSPASLPNTHTPSHPLPDAVGSFGAKSGLQRRPGQLGDVARGAAPQRGQRGPELAPEMRDLLQGQLLRGRVVKRVEI